MARRRKGRVVVQTRKVRPKDKQIVINSTVTAFPSAAQQDFPLYTTTFPATVTGLRWQINFGDTTGMTIFYWCIYLLRDGVPPGIVTGTGTLFTPEQNVLAWGTGMTENKNNGESPSIYKDRGQSKGMRKMMGGDRLMFSYTASSFVTAAKMSSCFQFFLLS